MYAIFRTAGKQFRAEPGRTVRIPSVAAELGAKLTFDEILIGSTGKVIKAGTPLVLGGQVTAEVVRHGKDRKNVVFKKKRRKGYRRKQGHRQGFTEIKIDTLSLGKRSIETAMAHKMGVGSSRNGRDSGPKYLGVKRYGGQQVVA